VGTERFKIEKGIEKGYKRMRRKRKEKNVAMGNLELLKETWERHSQRRFVGVNFYCSADGIHWSNNSKLLGASLHYIWTDGCVLIK